MVSMSMARLAKGSGEPYLGGTADQPYSMLDVPGIIEIDLLQDASLHRTLPARNVEHEGGKVFTRPDKD